MRRCDNVFLKAILQAAKHQAVSVGVGHHLVNLGNNNFVAVPGQASEFEFLISAGNRARVAGVG